LRGLAAKPTRVHPGTTFGELVLLATLGTPVSYPQQHAEYVATNGIDTLPLPSGTLPSRSDSQASIPATDGVLRLAHCSPP
jgi:hypothetical protein